MAESAEVWLTHRISVGAAAANLVEAHEASAGHSVSSTNSVLSILPLSFLCVSASLW
jgi:hypothetical protein